MVARNAGEQAGYLIYEVTVQFEDDDTLTYRLGLIERDDGWRVGVTGSA